LLGILGALHTYQGTLEWINPWTGPVHDTYLYTSKLEKYMSFEQSRKRFTEKYADLSIAASPEIGIDAR
jgi:hypothetical protein